MILDPHPRRVGVAPAPEQLEGPVEDREILAPVHEQRPTRVIDLVPYRDVDVLKCLQHVEHPAHMDFKTGRTKQPAKDEKVVSEM